MIHTERTDPVNISTLKHILKSPRHYLHALSHPQTETDAMRLGTALHACVYEPQTWTTRYVVAPNFHRGRKDATALAAGYDGGREAALAWDLAHVGAQSITREQFQAVEAMNASLKSDRIAAGYIVGGKAEQLVTWTDAETGIACRGRVDHYNGCLSDLKSCANIDPRAISRQIGALGYHAQLAFYHDGLEANGIVLAEAPALIFVESCAPYDVVVYEFEPDDIAAGRAVYRAALHRLSDCRASGVWPGVGRGERMRVEIPAWATSMDDTEPLTLGGEVLF